MTYSQRDETDARKMRRRLNDLLEMAAKAEIITEGIEQPFWKEVLHPLLQNYLRQLAEDALTMDPDTFVARQAEGKFCKWLEFQILSHVGQKQTFLEEASGLSAKLAAAETKGRIRPEEK